MKQIKVKTVHFAWDKYTDKDIVVPRFRQFKDIVGLDHRRMIFYCLTNCDTTHEQDWERVYTLRDLGYDPYIMVYDKEHT